MSPIVLVELGEKEEEATVITGKNILLKLFEDKSKQQSLSSSATRNVVKHAEELCKEDTRKHITAILDAYDRQLQLCQAILRVPFSDIMVSKDLQLLSKILLQSNFRLDFFQPKPKKKLSKKEKERKETEYFQNIVDQFIDAWSKDFEDQLKKNDKDMVRHEKELQKETPDFHLLSPTCILVCPHCRQPCADQTSIDLTKSTNQTSTANHSSGSARTVIWGEIKGDIACNTCQKTFNRKTARRISLHQVDDNLVKVIRQNLWFEDYFASILESLGWQVWKRPRVMGMSGIPHEIDVVGIKKGYVVCVECKTARKINREEVFTFSVKLADIKAHFGILFMLGTPAESETKEFLAKNPVMLSIESVSTKTRRDILDEFKSMTIGRV